MKDCPPPAMQLARGKKIVMTHDGGEEEEEGGNDDACLRASTIGNTVKMTDRTKKDAIAAPFNVSVSPIAIGKKLKLTTNRKKFTL